MSQMVCVSGLPRHGQLFTKKQILPANSDREVKTPRSSAHQGTMNVLGS